MLNAKYGVMLYAQTYTWSEALYSMLYKREYLCSLLYMD